MVLILVFYSVPAGVYLLEVVDGNKKVTRRLVKQ
ncbi:T9SS type A sorting domain-containing protein [Chitinophaga sp. 212800010-3]